MRFHLTPRRLEPNDPTLAGRSLRAATPHYQSQTDRPIKAPG